VWLEWPMVNSVGCAVGCETDCAAACAALVEAEFIGADTWAV
jgi:hypothetical protein